MSGEERITVHEAELARPQQRGRFINAFCHIHGSDHQRSLHINAENGFGKCHACGAQVFVPELSPDGARSPSARPRRITAEALLRPPRRPPANDPTPAAWQRDELAALQRLAERMVARLADDRARAYLAERHIPYDIARAAGVGYIPAAAKLSGSLAKWRDRLLFPLGSPAGVGYAGRSLHLWRPGMDENEQKTLLDALTAEEERAAEEARKRGEYLPVLHRRWEKTYPAGWMGYAALATLEHAAIAEGPFDALALMAAGILDVAALVGTAARAEWIPANVRGVVLALDGDAKGQERARTLRHELRATGLDVTICTPPAEDDCGKDWSERWRTSAREGVLPVFTALDALTRTPEPAPAPEPRQSASSDQYSAVDVPFAPENSRAHSEHEGVPVAGAPTRELLQLRAGEGYEVYVARVGALDITEPEARRVWNMPSTSNIEAVLKRHRREP